MTEPFHICFVCGRMLSTGEMSRSGGSYTYCKVCHAERMCKWRATNTDSYRESLRRSNRKHKEERDAYKADKRIMHPEIHRAHNTAQYHLKDKQPCEVCGSLDTQRHHDDYSKPLEVRWVCPLHHKGIHIKEVV